MSCASFAVRALVNVGDYLRCGRLADCPRKRFGAFVRSGSHQCSLAHTGVLVLTPVCSASHRCARPHTGVLGLTPVYSGSHRCTRPHSRLHGLTPVCTGVTRLLGLRQFLSARTPWIASKIRLRCKASPGQTCALYIMNWLYSAG